VDDQEVNEFLKLEESFFKDLGNGLLEDIFPYFKDVFPTAKWKGMVGSLNAITTILRTKFNEHVETFEPG
jgi:hypothetical protein